MNVYDRCLTRGLPGAMMPGFYNHNYLILQTPDVVVLQVEMIHDARIIPLTGRPHLQSGVRQWLGDRQGPRDRLAAGERFGLRLAGGLRGAS